jgi:probable rRNA maturation factor
MPILIDIQRACTSEKIPSDIAITRWVKSVLDNHDDPIELSIRVVGEAESAALNQQYRGKSGATNVLSFPFSAVTPEPLPLLGDLVICAPIVTLEASQQKKAIEAHWAHMVIHGVLHLLGYDHGNDDEAQTMETLETEILLGLNYPAPYTDTTEYN